MASIHLQILNFAPRHTHMQGLMEQSSPSRGFRLGDSKTKLSYMTFVIFLI